MPGVLVVCAVAAMRIVGSMVRVRTVANRSWGWDCRNGAVLRRAVQLRVPRVIHMPAMRLTGWRRRRGGYFCRRPRFSGRTFRVMWISRLGRCLDGSSMRVMPVMRRVLHRVIRSVLSRGRVRVLVVPRHSESR